VSWFCWDISAAAAEEGGEALFAFRNTGGERVSNKGERGFGKASDRVKAEDYRPQGSSVVVWWGALSKEGEKLGRWKAIIRFPVSSPRALIKH
jgi:hypothetical protein